MLVLGAASLVAVLISPAGLGLIHDRVESMLCISKHPVSMSRRNTSMNIQDLGGRVRHEAINPDSR